MGHWDQIRAQARKWRAALVADATHSLKTGADLLSAAELLRMAEDVEGAIYVPLPAGDPLLYGAEAWIDTSGGDTIVYYNDEVEEKLASFYMAHELAHLWLHQGAGGEPGCERIHLDDEASDTVLPVGVQRVEGYGPRERREREANVFAREFLLPADALRRWYLQDGLNASQIAHRVGVRPGVVYHQLAYALLAPEIVSRVEEAPAEESAGVFELDPSQRAAAHAERGPLLVEAGPGTGKTRTLTGRVAHLLAQGVAPTAILALTFSNKAAEEMRTRLARLAPEAAPKIWIGTFHSFGLELLSKYGTRLALPPRPEIIDPVDALLWLERSLPALKLKHYINLYAPSMYLPDILQAISRAKDELVGPEQYEQLARGMLERAETPEDVESAERALEVAGVYRFYQAHLEREGLLDFGDLIFRAVTLLREYPDARERVRLTYTHQLVDEFQDINRASGLLLREVAGEGRGLWAVGDARQAIYRFRGAAPVNMRLFTDDYTGARVLSLEVNYRSQPPIVDMFAELAPRMAATRGMDFRGWQARREHDGGRVIMEVAEDDRAEAEGIAGLIEAHAAEGIAYREQAVLCRSHTTLARIGAVLEAKGVPILYLGDLFERDEVRDLLSLLSLMAGGDTGGLLRVARFPEYAVPFPDVRAVLDLCKSDSLDLQEALSRLLAGGDLSEQGAAGLALLSMHMEEASGDTPWQVLTRYLFKVSGYLRHLLSDVSVAGQQKRLAIFQFLQFVHEQDDRFTRDEGDPRKHFLEYVRRLEIFGEERSLRQVPDWADGIDAVRMLTVHASKGLEFRAVYLPALGNGYFPSRRHSEPCPPPEGLLAAGDVDWHLEEEECLFFVALSRARDVLCLTRAKKYGKANSNPSPLLSHIAPKLPRPVDGPAGWAAKSGTGDIEMPPLPEQKPRFLSRMLELYMECPRQFYYEYMLGLGGDAVDAAYVRFHRSVYRAINYVRDEQAAGRILTPPQAFERLDAIWAEEGLPGHVHEEIYYEQARAMLLRAMDRSAGRIGPRLRPTWEVPLPYGRVAFTPDVAEVLEDGPEKVIRLQRLRTGRVSSKEKDNPVYALYHRSARRAHPEMRHQVQALYLSSDDVVDIILSDKQVEAGLAKYDKAIAGILGGRFQAEPSERRCPRCPHYFICPAAGEA